MTALSAPMYVPAGGQWTVDDLAAMPESSLHHEIIDGTLIVSPQPVHGHNSLAARLIALLIGTCPPDWEVNHDAQVQITPKRVLVPDILVVRESVAAINPQSVAPTDVLLAVEIVSEGSKVRDRVEKPTLYSAGGIACYWRIETDPQVVLHTYELRDGSYIQTGMYGKDDLVTTEQPWRLSFPLRSILPAAFRRQA